MKYIFILICLFIGLLILRSKGINRLTWLIIGILFTYNDIVIINTPYITSHQLYLISFVGSLILHKEMKEEFKSFPFKKITFIILIILCCIGFLDLRINLASKIARIFYYFLSYFTLFIGFSAIKNLNEWNIIQKKSRIYFLFIGIFGLLTWILQQNPYYDIVTSTFRIDNEVGIWSEVQDRGYRVVSTIGNPIVYGFLMGTMLLHFLKVFQNKKNTFYILCGIVLLSNLILANSRTGIVALGLCILLFLLLIYKLSIRFLMYIIGGVICIIGIYICIPTIQPILDSVIDIALTGGEKTVGSNMDTKVQQQETALLFFYNAPFFGNGFSYFNEVIKTGHIYSYNNELAGMEGFGYMLLVEQGIFMIIANIAFFTQLLLFFWKKRKRYSIANLFISTLISFLFFILLAGTYGNVMTYYFLYFGLCIKYLLLKEKQYTTYNHLFTVRPQ